MARRPRAKPTEIDLEGLEYFDVLMPLLTRLKSVGTQRDRAGNRQLFYDQYVCLLLLYFFSPTITSDWRQLDFPSTTITFPAPKEFGFDGEPLQGGSPWRRSRIGRSTGFEPG